MGCARRPAGRCSKKSASSSLTVRGPKSRTRWALVTVGSWPGRESVAKTDSARRARRLFVDALDHLGNFDFPIDVTHGQSVAFGGVLGLTAK